MRLFVFALRRNAARRHTFTLLIYFLKPNFCVAVTRQIEAHGLRWRNQNFGSSNFIEFD
jgi:hypothetical protein